MTNTESEKDCVNHDAGLKGHLKSIFDKSWVQKITIYRIIAAIGLIIAIALALAAPAHMLEPDDWSYYYAIQNFAEGKLVVNDSIHNLQSSETQAQVGHSIDYVNIGPDKWALEKAPGYVVYEIPFELKGIPRWGNVILAVGVVIVTFLLLKRLLNEKAACIGSLLMLFTPASLIMLNRSYMDSFASGAFLVIGGALYIYWVLERNHIGRRQSFSLLFFAFLFIAWSVVTRYTNVVVAVIFAIHYEFLLIRALIKRMKNDYLFEIPAVLLGIGIPLCFFLTYNKVVFGSPLDYGYRYSQGDITFAFQHIGEVTQTGQSVVWQIIKGNFQSAPRDLLLGFPLLFLAIPVFVIALWSAFRRNRDDWSNLSPVLRWDILLLLLGWFAGVFLLYLTYEWTSTIGPRPFIVFARFYLPGLFPLVSVSALLLSKFRVKLALTITAILLIVGSVFYFQSLNSEKNQPVAGPPVGVNVPPHGNQPPRLQPNGQTAPPSTQPPPPPSGPPYSIPP